MTTEMDNASNMFRWAFVSKLLLFKKGRAIRAVRVIYRRLATAEWIKCEPPLR